MSFDELLRARRLRPHETTPEEIAALFARARRDHRHARVSTDSEDWRFIAGYSAALSLATIPMVASGYRASGPGHHVTVITALPASLGSEAQELTRYLNECREVRNQALYEKPGLATKDQVENLLSAVEELRARVLAWLEENRPELLPDVADDA
ncbi:MAG: hypothetical protein U9R79_09715 [Armatimonadota bacterium]|nr:hypothetical protein [Armatimonadota bacterium]